MRSGQFTSVTRSTLLLIVSETIWSWCHAEYIEEGSNLTTWESNSTSNQTITANLSAPKMRDLYNSGLKLHPKRCHAHGRDLNLIMLVVTSPDHFHRRIAIRKSWGLQAKKSNIPLVFVIGTSPERVLNSVIKESKSNKDIMICNSVDSYTNLTMKIISALEWIQSNCHRVKKVLKTDDDVFINIPNLISFVQDTINTTNTIWGWLQPNIVPERIPEKKYYLPFSQFKGEKLPNFTAGPTYILSGEIVSALRRKALTKTRTFFNLEDVFFTGILAEELNISRVDAVEINNEKQEGRIHPCVVKNFVSLHGVKYHEQTLYQDMLSDKQNC